VLIVVKPRDCDITTNLVLATDRRLYDLTLDAPPCRGRSTNPQQPYVRHVRFYYPDETIAQWANHRTPRRPGRPDLLSLNFGYRVKKDRQFRWAPAQVFDDGRGLHQAAGGRRHAEARCSSSSSRREQVLVNYSVVGGHVRDGPTLRPRDPGRWVDGRSGRF